MKPIPIIIAPEPCWSCGGMIAHVDEMKSRLLRLRCAECNANPPPFRSTVREALRAWHVIARAETAVRKARTVEVADV